MMEQRLAVARAVARHMLQQRGEPVTEEAIEREAAIIAAGLYIEQANDPAALLTEQRSSGEALSAPNKDV